MSSGSLQNVAKGIRIHQVDIRSERLAEVFEAEKPDVVSHQAARANVRESFEKPLLYAEVNVVGSVNVLECCRRFGVRKLVYASTGGAVYGEPASLPVSEDHPINPLDPYGASKHHVEHYLHLYGVNFDIRFTALRYPNVYGPRQDPRGEAGVVAVFAGQMLGGGKPVINGTGEQQRDFVYVTDVARANLLALQQADNQILNLGSGLGTSVNEIYQVLAELTGFSPKPVHGPAKKGEVSRIFLNSERARQSLNWQPQISLRAGLASTVEFFRSRQ
jgi:UDP-glucose 4-epimerase